MWEKPWNFSEKSGSGRRIKLPKYLLYFSNSKLAKINGPVPFPNNQQMVFDTGEDLKNQLKGIIKKNKFRK